MSTSKVLGSRTVSSLAELLSLLRRWSEDDLHQIPNTYVNVFGRNGDPVRARLIVDTLTDGSEVYNINLE